MDDIDEVFRAPVKQLKADHAIRAAAAQPHYPNNPPASKDTSAVHNSTAEMQTLLTRLSTLETTLANQATITAQIEVYMTKNFREQRHLNKDRKKHLRRTITSYEDSLKALEEDQSDQSKQVKNLEIRANSHGVQIKDMRKRVEMCAQGGEYMELLLEECRLENNELEERVRDLEEEVGVLRGRDGCFVRRIHELELLVRKGLGIRTLIWPGIAKQRVLDTARFAVGNHRAFSKLY